MPTNPTPSAKAAKLRGRAEAELHEIGAKPGLRPMMAELYRGAEAQVRKQTKNRRWKTVDAKSAADPRRLFHELQVHHVELEMQNAELQEAQDRMEALLEKYTDLYDFAPVGYLSLDERGQILEVNLTGAALLGVGRARLINRRLLDFVAPASHSILLAFLGRVFSRDGKQVCESTLVRENGTSFWASFHGISAVAANGSRKWCRVAISDISAVKQAEEMLRQNEALFSALIEQAPVGVYVVDADLRLQQVNPKARPVFSNIRPLEGRDFSEIIRILWAKKVADNILERFRHTLKTGKPYYSPEFSELRHDIGVREIYEWQLQRITLPAGHHGVVCFFNNITERKRTEATQRRIDVLAASNLKLEQQIVRRKALEESLKKSERHQRRLLAESHRMQEQLRHLSRQVLLAQEEERKRISRELHDVIAQTLTGISIRLATLNKTAGFNSKSFDRNIARTQKLVEHSVNIVHQFARELRPAVLDDLGLIPALHSFMKTFAARTGLRTGLTAFAGVEQLDTIRRTVLFRVAQEALTNVARHAQASRVDVSIEKLSNRICMKIKDDGKSFQVHRILHSTRNNRLGLLGMRERLEMIGGNFGVESVPGKGTAIVAQIPFGKARAGGTTDGAR